MTKNLTTNIKFTLDEETVVYMKCRPHKKSDTISVDLDKNWMIVLDVADKNGQWTLESQS